MGTSIEWSSIVVYQGYASIDSNYDSVISSNYKSITSQIIQANEYIALIMIGRIYMLCAFVLSTIGVKNLAYDVKWIQYD